MLIEAVIIDWLATIGAKAIGTETADIVAPDLLFFFLQQAPEAAHPDVLP